MRSQRLSEGMYNENMTDKIDTELIREIDSFE